MKRNLFFSKLFMVFLAGLILSSCANDKNEKSAQIEQQKITPKQPETQPQAPSYSTINPPPDLNLPVLSFSKSTAISDTKNEVRLELQLSKASSVPVVAEVLLINGSARYLRDFNGFKSGLASIKAETHLTVIFAPNSTHQPLSVIGVRNTINCDTDFFVKISNNLKNARLVKDKIKVIIPCR